MEIAVLTQLEWRVHCNTAYDFVGVLGLTSLIRAGDEINGMAVGPSDPPGPHTADVDLLIRRYAGFFVDLSVYEFPHGSQPASLTAAAAVAAARVLFSVSPTWPDCLRRDSGYAQPALHETLSMLLECARRHRRARAPCARRALARAQPVPAASACVSCRAASSCTTSATTGPTCSRWPRALRPSLPASDSVSAARTCRASRCSLRRRSPTSPHCQRTMPLGK